MTTFYLVRHGECRGIGEVLWGRSPNVHLSAEGKHSAKVVAGKLSQLKLEMVYSSPLERAMETAHEISSGCSLPTIVNQQFNEIDYGEWTGESFPTLSEKPLWRRYNAFRSSALIPGGESLQNARKRIVSEMGRLTDLHRDQRIAIVTHAEPIRIALSYFHQIPSDEWYRIDVAPASISVVTLNEAPNVATL
jgi:probable phosphoglycerate mutase